jgi:hypothetical protein
VPKPSGSQTGMDASGIGMPQFSSNLNAPLAHLHLLSYYQAIAPPQL